MSQVEFEEFQVKSTIDYKATPKIIRWILNYSWGLVKNEKQAQSILFIFLLVVIVISLIFLFTTGGNKQEPVIRMALSKI